MAYPIDPSEGYLRTPARYPHDAFAADTGGRVRPHSGLDSTPTVKNARARAVLGGRVNQAGFTIYAGNFVVVRDASGLLWLSIHMASRAVREGKVVGEDDIIGIVGNTGGGGVGPLAGKTGRLAYHLHVSLCRDQAAVDRIIHGLVRPRYKGESRARWAKAHGLLDPYPHIMRSLKPSTPAKTPEQIEEEEIMSAIDKIEKMLEGQTKTLWSYIQREGRPEVYYIDTDERGNTYTIDDSPAAALIHPASGFIMPLDDFDDDGRGQVDSLKRRYRIISNDSRPEGFHESVFYNTIKDVARGSGIIDRANDEAAGVAWAKALFTAK